MASKRTLGVFIVILLLLAAVYTLALWRIFTGPSPGGNDFLANVTPWEAYFKYGINPYSDEAALYTQRLIYGRPAFEGEDQNRLVYPFYSALIHAPFMLLDYSLARALYMTLLHVAIFGGVLMTLRTVAWLPSKGILAMVLAWSILHYPEARSILLGQFAPLGFFFVLSSLSLLQARRDFWAGACLVLSTIKPTLVFLIVPFLLVWTLTRRRWSFLVGFGLVLGTLSLASILVLPTWMGDWFERIKVYREYTVGESPIWHLTHAYLPILGSTGEWVISGLLFAAMLWVWSLAVRNPERPGEILWGFGITLIVSNLIVPRSATTNYVLLLHPTLWCLAATVRSHRRGTWIAVGVMFALLVGYWWLHLTTVVGNQEHALLFFPLPVLLGVVLVLGREWLLKDAYQAGVPV